MLQAPGVQQLEAVDKLQASRRTRSVVSRHTAGCWAGCLAQGNQPHSMFRRGLHTTMATVLLLGVLAAVVTQGAAIAGTFDRSSCPSWLQQYEQFHIKNRVSPTAKYLVANCPPWVGVGDHLRGMMYALRAAAATDRVLLIEWQNHGPLTDYLVPNSGINWTFAGTPATQLSKWDLMRSSEITDVFDNQDLKHMFTQNNYFAWPPGNKTFLGLRTNFPADTPCVKCQPVNGSAASQDLVCLFQFLFKPSPEVERRTDKHLRLLYPGRSPSSVDYAALHLRVGHMHGEPEAIERNPGWGGRVDALTKLLTAVPCATGLAREDGGIDVTETPLLMLADHKGIRHFARAGHVANVVTPVFDAVHTKASSRENHMQAFVDINLMARAKCLVYSRSGFSSVGLWMHGDASCTMLLSDCHQACRKNSSLPLCS